MDICLTMKCSTVAKFTHPGNTAQLETDSQITFVRSDINEIAVPEKHLTIRKLHSRLTCIFLSH